MELHYQLYQIINEYLSEDFDKIRFEEILRQTDIRNYLLLSLDNADNKHDLIRDLYPIHFSHSLNDPNEAMEKFKKTLPLFGTVLDKFPKGILISGSSALAAVDGDPEHEFLVNDIDMYLIGIENIIERINEINDIIFDVYSNEYDIKIVRTPYLLTWYVIKDLKNSTDGSDASDGNDAFKNVDDILLATYQLILPPAENESQIFSAYHSDIVCVGYSTTSKNFIYAKTRFDWFMKHQRAHFFPFLTKNPNFFNKVEKACNKYRDRGYHTNLVKPHKFGEYIPETPIEVSDIGIDFDKLLAENRLSYKYININRKLETISRENNIFRVAEDIRDVYFGEVLKPYIETMGIAYMCPRCKTYSFSKFCNKCQAIEETALADTKQLLNNDTNSKFKTFITGGRCGLGYEIRKFLNPETTYYTSRYPNLLTDSDSKLKENCIKLDLKQPETWNDTKSLLESGEINLLILNAAETLHYKPESEKEMENIKPIEDDDMEKLTEKIDWTNDWKRDNTGIWHKTIDYHSYDEIIDPLLVNIAGCSALLGMFVTGAKKRLRKSIKPDAPYFAIVVTSFEGRFEDKTPFHPITNASKSGIEQVVWTLRHQADQLGINIVLADPGWMYTESARGKMEGPVPPEFGATQVLSPYITYLNNKKVENGSLWRR
jgi:hypothetical protein